MVANALESANIATLVIGTMHAPLDDVPRAIVTPFINAPVGPAGNKQIQHDVIAKALHLLTSAKEHTVETVRTDEARS